MSRRRSLAHLLTPMPSESAKPAPKPTPQPAEEESSDEEEDDLAAALEDELMND